MNRLIGAVVVLALAGAARPAATSTDLTGTWQGSVTRNGRAWSIRFSAWPTATGTRVCLDFADYGLYYRCTTDVAVTGASVSIKYVAGRDVVTLVGELTPRTFTGRWNGLGVDADFRAESAAPTQPLVEENVRFTNGDVTLAGTLVHPAGERRYPAVVWTHGSGNQKRTEDFYRDRGYLLAEHGMAALIYDKRGVGESTGDPESTLDELAGDAVSAVQFLQTRADIDANIIGIGGFSQGGFVAPLAASRYGRIAFVVVGATPGVSPAELNDYAGRTALARKGFPADTIARAMALRADVLQAQETGDRIPEVDRQLASAKSEPWFGTADLPSTVRQYGPRGLSVLRFDPQPVWTSLTVPVFSVWGADDVLVPVEKSKALIDEWLRQAGNRHSTTRVFPGAGHGLAVTSQPGIWDWPRLAPGFHDAMIQWIAARVAELKRPPARF